MSIPDNYSELCRHEAEQEERLGKMPVCCDCGEHIQAETCFDINETIICEECMEQYRKYTDDLIC